MHGKCCVSRESTAIVPQEGGNTKWRTNINNPNLLCKSIRAESDSARNDYPPDPREMSSKIYHRGYTGHRYPQYIREQYPLHPALNCSIAGGARVSRSSHGPE